MFEVGKCYRCGDLYGKVRPNNVFSNCVVMDVYDIDHRDEPMLTLAVPGYASNWLPVDMFPWEGVSGVNDTADG